MAKRKTWYGLELKPGRAPASFMASGKTVDLTEEGEVFKTADRRAYETARLLPFLNDLGEVPSPHAKAGADDDSDDEAGEAQGEDG